MAKKKEQITKKTCSCCVHEFACQMWNIGNIHNMDAERCGNHETVKESPAYLIGLMDGRAEKQTNAGRIRAMSDEEMARFLAEVENRRSAAGGGAIWKEMARALEWLRQPAEED